MAQALPGSSPCGVLVFLDADEAERTGDEAEHIVLRAFEAAETVELAMKSARMSEKARLEGLIEMYSVATEELVRAGDPVLLPLMRDLLGGFADAHEELARLKAGVAAHR